MPIRKSGRRNKCAVRLDLFTGDWQPRPALGLKAGKEGGPRGGPPFTAGRLGDQCVQQTRQPLLPRQ